jgi:hypothetical protein
MKVKFFVLLILLSVLAAGALAEPADDPSMEETVSNTPTAALADPDPCCTLRGDVNNNGGLDIGDFTMLLGYAFQGGSAPSCMDHADANADGVVNVQDILIILRASFGMGSPPVPC